MKMNVFFSTHERAGPDGGGHPRLCRSRIGRFPKARRRAWPTLTPRSIGTRSSFCTRSRISTATTFKSSGTWASATRRCPTTIPPGRSIPCLKLLPRSIRTHWARPMPSTTRPPTAESHFCAPGSLYTSGYGRTPRIKPGVAPIEEVFSGLNVFDAGNAPWLGVYRLDVPRGCLSRQPAGAGGLAHHRRRQGDSPQDVRTGRRRHRASAAADGKIAGVDLSEDAVRHATRSAGL